MRFIVEINPIRCIIALLVVLLLATLCFGREPTTLCGGHVTVSDQLPMPVKYPPECAKMTAEEFYVWAVQQNAKAVAEWKAKKAALTEPEYLDGRETTDRGFREGYDSTGSNSPVNGLGRIYARFYTDAPSDNRYYGWDTRTQTTRQTRYPNPNYTSPGPLTIINPYVKP